MTVIGEVLFFLLVVANVVTLFKLSSPFSYRDRGVATWLALSSWSALLFDAGFLTAVLGFGGTWVELALLLSLTLRLALSVWLIWNLPRGSQT